MKKQESTLEAWIDEQMLNDPDFRRRVQRTLEGMRLKQETVAFFTERHHRANRKEFGRIMRRTGGEPPREGDEIVDGAGEKKAARP